MRETHFIEEKWEKRSWRVILGPNEKKNHPLLFFYLQKRPYQDQKNVTGIKMMNQ